MQYLRSLSGVFWNVATCSAPAVTLIASGGQRLKAFTGPPDHDRQDRQWQYPIAAGSPVASRRTAPQKHSPTYVIAVPRPPASPHSEPGPC